MWSREATVALQVLLQDQSQPSGHDHQNPGGEITHRLCKSRSSLPDNSANILARVKLERCPGR